MNFKNVENIKEYVQVQMAEGRLASGAYVKATTVTARKGTVGERISTIMSNGLHETDNVVSEDANGNVDWVVTNIAGEQYVVKDAVFREKYEPEGSTPDTFKPKEKPIVAGQIHENISFIAPWGEVMNLLAGGYLVFSDMEDIYGIQENEFKMTYKKL